MVPVATRVKGDSMEERARFIKHMGEVEACSCPGGLVRSFISREEGHAIAIQRFSLDGQSHVHRHDDDMLYYIVLLGQGTVYLDNNQHALQAGDIISVPPGVTTQLEGRMEFLTITTPAVKADKKLFEVIQEPSHSL